MAMLRTRVKELLLTIPNLPHSNADPIASFEVWLGVTEDDGPSIEDKTPPDAFFCAFGELLRWVYYTPIHPLQAEQDFENLESIQVTKWLRHCLDVHVEGGFALKLLASGPETLLEALYHHINHLSQLQSVQHIYTQSLRQDMGVSRLEEFKKIQSIADQLQAALDQHLQRLEYIMGELYASGSVQIRSVYRRYLATYWHYFVVHSDGGGVVQENTRASGISMTLRVLLRILMGSTTLQKSHQHLLLYSLLPLHQPNSLVLWRDQTSILELYHEPLVQCMAVLFQKEPSWISPTLEGLLNAQVWTPSNTPKCILLLHEVDLILKILPEGETLPIWSSLFNKLTTLMASDNSRLSERALQFFRNDRFRELFYDKVEESLPSLIKAIVKPADLPWNPTVRKMIYNVLKGIYDKEEDAFAKACQSAFGGVKVVDAIPPPAMETPNDATSTPPATNKRASKAPDFSLKAGMGDWRPPKRNQSGMPPPSSRTRGRPPVAGGSIGRGIAPWKAGNQPPLAVTGVASWANKSSQPPSTVTGVAPWAFQSNVVQEPKIAPPTNDAPPSITQEFVVNSGVTNNPALASVLKYMEDIKPAGEQEGVSSWSKTQMAESPTLLPSLKFHDLVFGHDLGSGAFGEVKYARRIDQSKTRSHWAEYAVKIISTQKITEMGYEMSVQREIATLHVMSHPGIARLISSFRFRDGAYLVLEYASQGDLHMLLRKKGSLDHESTRFVIGEVVAVLSSIHELGFVYGDLKTENTVITETGHIKLTDFGACRSYTEEAKELIRKSATNLLKELRDGDWKPKKQEKALETDEVVVGWNGDNEDFRSMDCSEEIEEDFRIEGTSAYLPPEVVLGAIPTPAADMWALGCLLYQCLTGRPPLLEDDDDMTRKKIVSFDQSPREALFGEECAKDVQEDAKALIRKLLTRNMLERPTIGKVADDTFFGGKNVYTLYREPSHPLDIGTVAPVADAKWGRRQLSSIWAPQPKAYDISMTAENVSVGTSGSNSAPIAEGDEASSFFSFTKRSGPLHQVNEYTES